MYVMREKERKGGVVGWEGEEGAVAVGSDQCHLSKLGLSRPHPASAFTTISISKSKSKATNLPLHHINLTTLLSMVSFHSRQLFS